MLTIKYHCPECGSDWLGIVRLSQWIAVALRTVKFRALCPLCCAPMDVTKHRHSPAK